MTNAIRLYRTYILSENVPMNTNKIGSGHLFSPGTEKDAMSYTRAYFFKKKNPERKSTPGPCLVWMNGLEPTTPCMSSKCSNQLSYTHIPLLLYYIWQKKAIAKSAFFIFFSVKQICRCRIRPGIGNYASYPYGSK